MALTSLDKDTTNRLMNMIVNNETVENKDLEIIKKNYSGYSKLEIIIEQIKNLERKAEEIINDCRLNEHLHNIQMQSKKVPGCYYYHYLINDKEILSIIAPDEWDTYTTFYGKYLFNYDGLFYIQH